MQENWDSEADEDATADSVDKEARTAQVADGTTSPQGQQKLRVRGIHWTKGRWSRVGCGRSCQDKLDKLTV